MPWSAVAAGIAAGGQLIGGQKMNRRAARVAREQMAFQRQQQATSMEFAERMSSTAHQRQVADLRAAGLNPILAAHGGASSPSVGMGSGAMPDLVDPIGGATEAGVSTAMAARAHRQELKNLKAQKAFVDEQKRGASAIADREEAQNDAYRWYRDRDGKLVMSNSMLGLGEQWRTELDALRANLALTDASARERDSNTALNIARLPREESISRIFSSPFATPLAAALLGGAALSPARALVHFRRPAASSARSAAQRLRQTRFPLNLYRRRGAGYR